MKTALANHHPFRATITVSTVVFEDGTSARRTDRRRIGDSRSGASAADQHR
ncbi:hypothetical protein [Haladaptatus salinisoli]|uniref:hypothetical protein n=1 Tax=Haladaptatus salinisoli TaxID=2884876 RepID=UPI001D0AB849|nr:hypothetical protein [Haladaptatus salinisoli]